MTIIEMHTKCDHLMDKAGAPWFNATEKDLFLNMAQLEFVKTRHKDYEVNEQYRQDLFPITRVYSITSLDVNIDSITRFLYTLAISVTAKDKCGVTYTVPVPPMQWDDYYSSEIDPFNKAEERYPVYITNSDGTNRYLYIKGIESSNFISGSMTYLINPVELVNDENTPANNVNCIMPEQTHDEIVNIAVRKMLGIAKDPNYQVQINEMLNQKINPNP